MISSPFFLGLPLRILVSTLDLIPHPSTVLTTSRSERASLDTVFVFLVSLKRMRREPYTGISPYMLAYLHMCYRRLRTCLTFAMRFRLSLIPCTCHHYLLIFKPGGFFSDSLNTKSLHLASMIRSSSLFTLLKHYRPGKTQQQCLLLPFIALPFRALNQKCSATMTIPLHLLLSVCQLTSLKANDRNKQWWIIQLPAKLQPPTLQAKTMALCLEALMVLWTCLCRMMMIQNCFVLMTPVIPPNSCLSRKYTEPWLTREAARTFTAIILLVTKEAKGK